LGLWGFKVLKHKELKLCIAPSVGPVPLGNMNAILRAKQNTRAGDNFWCSVTACGNDNGQSGYVDVGGTIVGYDH